ncbi:uncharacterized protein LOC115528959 [Gadus morhua]|uniref:uncharacterized protein LOC115528959 n=1 Tax=Gadus morhua TaxID=8049 RepID=UPI0011B502CD|nr:uncharacterized protein LOC115528959 [Gadus morhua]
MLKPRRRSDLLLPDVPPVFGKPWFWHRSSGTMETSRSLAQVIMEMQDDIQNLDGDKRGRREDSFGDFPGPPRERPKPAALENPYANLRRNASAPALDVQYQENTVMTVRRYSIASHLSGGSGAEGSSTSSRKSGSGWGRLQEELHPGSTATRSKKQTLQDLVHKSRAKVKTVTFLLPLDDIYTNRPGRSRPLEDPSDPDPRDPDPRDPDPRDPDPRATELDPLTETDY